MRHRDRAHALLSPSSSHRWLVCTPSAMQEAAKEDTHSIHTVEGTLAHEVAEYCLKKALGIKSPNSLKDLGERAKAAGYEFSLMEKHAEEYTDYILSKMREGDAVIVEQKVSMEGYAEGCYGTCDCLILSDGTLTVVDYKYGKNVPVEAEGNTQLMLYALGAVLEYEAFYAFSKINLCIFQPRIDLISEASMSRDALMRWARDKLAPKAKLALKGQGEAIAGEHCRFCKMAGECDALYKSTMEIVAEDFDSEGSFIKQKPQRMAEALSQVPLVELWLRSTKDESLKAALNGVRIPGYKLVEGRSVRKYDDEKVVRKKLKAAGYKLKDINKPTELLGITALKKAIGKESFEEYVEPLLLKPPGKPTLVENSDPRQELNSLILNDFMEVEK